MPASEPIAPLFSQITLLLKRQRFKRESDEAGFAIFGRKLDGSIERVGIRTTSGGSKKDEAAISVVMGIEFSDLEPERIWIGMPRTHGSVELRLLNKAAKKEYVCSADTDVKELATGLVALIVDASDELARRSEKLRKAYVSLVEARGSNVRKRLAIFAERKAKELKKATPKSRKVPTTPIKVTVNAFEIAAFLLRTKQDQMQELEIHDFDETEAHDRRLTQRVVQQFIDKAMEIQSELASILNAPLETGKTEHARLPINGVCHFAYWYVGWKLLYVVVSHEDIGLPCSLIMGAVARS